MSTFNLDPDNPLSPERGRLLIASPHLDDPYFQRTVILICDHNPEGSFGFVLNRYIEIDLPDLVNSLPTGSGRLSLGGPVENNSLYYLHLLPDLINDSQHVTGSLYLGGDFETITEGLKVGSITDAQVRFFVGYSGWSEGQLEEEISKRSWYVCEAEGLPLMDSHIDNLWQIALRSMGGQFANLAHFPADPKLN